MATKSKLFWMTYRTHGSARDNCIGVLRSAARVRCKPSVLLLIKKQVNTFSPSANATTAAVEYASAVGLYECFIRSTSALFCRTSATSEAVPTAVPLGFEGTDCKRIDILVVNAA